MNTYKRCAEQAQHLLEAKRNLDNWHQQIAEHFYPERADFTVSRAIGDDFAGENMTSFPALMRRDLGNQIGMMLRPSNRSWFHLAQRGVDKASHAAKEYLERFETTMRRAMYDPLSRFSRATATGDHDFAAFGQCALSLELNREGNRLLYRAWHLRDMAWDEDAEGSLGYVCRKWAPGRRQAIQVFGSDKLHPDIVRQAEKEPFGKVNFLHIVTSAENIDEASGGRPRWSIWWDCDHEQIVEKTPIWGRFYVIPRWAMLNSQYAHSPAAVCALPDARLIQAMTYTLLEAGEKSSNPPMIATTGAVQTTPAMYAGGITWLDKEYDERLGEALRPFPQDYRGVGHGMELAAHTEALIKEAFFLNKLSPFNPATDPEMTAYQAGQLVQEYIRQALPIFEPMEMEYNGALCEETFGLMARVGAFGSPLDWPKELQGADVEFRFESPLHDAIDAQKAQKWMEAKALLADAIALDSNTQFLFDAQTALRDAFDGMRVPAEWLRDEAEVAALAQEEVERQQAAQLLQQMEQGSKVAANMAQAEGL